MLDSQYANFPIIRGCLPYITFYNEKGDFELDLHPEENFKRVFSIVTVVFLELFPYLILADIIATAFQKVYEVQVLDKRIEEIVKQALS